MASTPFFLSGLLFLAWFTADVHSVKVLPDVLKGSSVVLRPVEAVTSITTIIWKHGDNLAADWFGGDLFFYNIFKVKVIDVLKGSTVVLHPVEAVTSITAITWKHGDNLAADWFGGDLFFYNIFEDTCSLNTETGELTIYNVRPEHRGVYTPDINGKTRSAMKLRVLSPVPKPSITLDCVPGETLTCTLTCKFDRTGDLGDVEVSWILDDRHEKNGTELQITKDTKEKTFICSLKNSVSSENSFKLQNPLLPSGIGVPVWIRMGLLAVLLVVFCSAWIYPKYRHYRIIKEIQETKMSEEDDL